MDTSLVPEIGTVPQALRSFRLRWVEELVRTERGEPAVGATFAAQHARLLHFLDVRERAELAGPLGRVPGSFSVLPHEIDHVVETLRPEDPIVVVDRHNERGLAFAKALEGRGFRMVAHMWGGVADWRAQGYGTTREKKLKFEKLARIEAVFSAEKRLLSKDDIRAHLGDPRAIHRQKLASLLTHGHLSCVDGRDHGALLGTPGGDGGELLLALSALEKLRGRAITSEEVAHVLESRLDAFGPCAIHTDIANGNKVIAYLRSHPNVAPHVENVRETLEWRKFFAQPPREIEDDILEALVTPEHLGCGHLKLSRLRADDYGTRAGLVDAFLRTFFRARWAGTPEAHYVPLPGGHAEGAVLRVRVAEEVGPFTEVPLVSPMCGGSQVFVAHPEVAVAMRRFVVRLFQDMGLVEADKASRLEREIDALAEVQLGHTLHALGEGLPIFDLHFDRRGCLDVEEAGVVG